MRVADEQWRRWMHRASQCAQFALAVGLPVAAFVVEPCSVLVAAVAAAFSVGILRHLEGPAH